MITLYKVKLYEHAVYTFVQPLQIIQVESAEWLVGYSSVRVQFLTNPGGSVISTLIYYINGDWYVE